jgi:ABC-type Fe3+ transport system substrate-binding protein
MRQALGAFIAAAVAGALLVAAGPVKADSLAELAAAAARKPAVIWYESSPPEEILKVSTAFNARYPDIKIQYVRITGGGGIASRVIQESSAGASTASFMHGDAQQVLPLQERGLLLSRDWKALGIDPAVVRAPYAVTVSAALGVLVWNKNKLKESDLPKTWDAFLEPKWNGKIGEWVRAPTLATLAKAFGEKHMVEYTQKLIALKPMIYPSTFQLAQQVAAGEVDIGMGLYHSAQPPIRKGAPLGVTFIDPTPVNSLYGAVITKGGNPEGAQVLLAWLTTPEGAKAYEDAVGRGNPLVKGTETASRVGSVKLVEFGFDESATLERLDTELTKMLKAAGQPR